MNPFTSTGGCRGVAVSLAVAGALCAVFSGDAAAQSAADDPWGESWPAGEGRELTGAWCGGCHSLNLVKQQGLTRDGWDGLLHWMSEEQNMPPLAGERREQVLDYLAASFGTGRDSRVVAAGDADRLPLPDPAQGIRLPPLSIR